MKMKCKCGDTAMIVRRYKGHEYRYCKKCNLKYITHEDNNNIVIDYTYEHRKHFFMQKGD